MNRYGRSVGLPALVLCVAATAPRPAKAQDTPVRTLRVLTFNVWHGLRSGESNWRFPGEEPARNERRFTHQIEEIQRLDPHLLLLQEVNPNQRQARRYASALGYDEIHKVTSCGLHLGVFYKIPRNVNDGMAILAKPGLELRRIGKKRLSGNARCSASWGFQTKESRYALFGEIVVAGRKVLVTTTHLSSPSFVLADFDHDLDRLARDGVLEPRQRDEIQAARRLEQQRHLSEVRSLLHHIDLHRARLAAGGAGPPVILGGDFNAAPGSLSLAAVKQANFRHVGAGPEFHTWDPVTNETNYRIGSERAEPLPTFGKPEVKALLAHRETTARQIDHIFVSPEVQPTSAELVLNREKDGIFPSDHFGILATLALP